MVEIISSINLECVSLIVSKSQVPHNTAIGIHTSIVSRTLPLENGCVRPGSRTPHQTLHMENEGKVSLLEIHLFSLGYMCLYMVPAGVGVITGTFMVIFYQESGYVVSSSGGFKSWSCGPRVYG